MEPNAAAQLRKEEPGEEMVANQTLFRFLGFASSDFR
jgi:hypothetical protein